MTTLLMETPKFCELFFFHKESSYLSHVISNDLTTPRSRLHYLILTQLISQIFALAQLYTCLCRKCFKWVEMTELDTTLTDTAYSVSYSRISLVNHHLGNEITFCAS